MDTTRRSLLRASSALALLPLTGRASAGTPQAMALGLLISPGDDPVGAVAKVKRLGFTNCFLSLDSYIGGFTRERAKRLQDALQQANITPTTVEVVGPGRLVWDFLEGPFTIGLVPEATRRQRMDALKGVSDFAKLLGVPQVQTHCGFIPENPKDPAYPGTVRAIREVAQHCAANSQAFLMETGQETPTTVLRTIEEVNVPALGVGLDTANLILYGKANPVDALEILGPHVKSVHAKDGLWPTDPMQLGKEVRIGQGKVDFHKVLRQLHALRYGGTITIERETSGPQQMADVQQEKAYLAKILADL